jgi:hypothetical protein
VIEDLARRTAAPGKLVKDLHEDEVTRLEAGATVELYPGNRESACQAKPPHATSAKLGNNGRVDALPHLRPRPADRTLPPSTGRGPAERREARSAWFSFQRFWYRDFFSFQRLCDHSQSGGAARICASTRRA